MNKDIIFSLISKELKRQREGIELIASENFVSTDVLTAMGSILTNKYAEGYPAKRYYGGCEVVDEIESLAIERIKKLFNCEYANVQPHSGAQANGAVLSLLLNPGDVFLGLDLSMGGHLTHGSLVNFSGKLYKPVGYTVKKDTHLVDYEDMAQKAAQYKPKLIICGASSYSRDWDYKRIREIADACGALVMADIAHPAGLIATGLLNNPFDYCHVVTSTTHKTLRGPRGGVILMKKDFPNPFGIKTNKGEIRMMGDLLNSAVFPGHQGGPLEHIIAAKAIAFNEALDPSFKIYGQQIIANVKEMYKHFVEYDFNIVSNGTDNHLLLIDLHNKNISGKAADEALGKAGITVNKNMIPYDDKSPMITSGIRVGVPAITSRGLKEKDMGQIVYFIHEAIKNAKDDNKLNALHEEVKKFILQFPLYSGLV